MADEEEQSAVAERLNTIHDYLREDLCVAGNGARNHNPGTRGGIDWIKTELIPAKA